MTVNGMKQILQKLVLEGLGQLRIQVVCSNCSQAGQEIDRVRPDGRGTVIIWLDE